MNIQFEKYPVDIIVFIFWSIILLPIVLFDMIETLKIALGLPFLLFIPGYMLIFILFPRKKEYNSIEGLERIGLSLGFSIALVSLVGLLLNYTPWGIRLEPILFTLFFLTEILGAIAIYRWKITNRDERFTISLKTSQIKSNKKIENILIIFLILSILIASTSIIYILVAPVTGESFTDFYILSPNHNVTNYPQDILVGENTSFIIGLINHEYTTMNYTIEIWLIEESFVFNESTKKNDTLYNHAWFMDKIGVQLKHTEITNEKNQTKKWEYNYFFKINRIGFFKLVLLLFTTPSEKIDLEQDYKDSIDLRIKNAYRELHLWLYVG
jgi:uncharacterized membrane protein